MKQYYLWLSRILAYVDEAPLFSILLTWAFVFFAHVHSPVFAAVPEPDKVITGTIRDKDSGQGLPGVSIVVKGTSNGTISDQDGKYQLSVPEKTTLVVSFIGYVSVEKPVENLATALKLASAIRNRSDAGYVFPVGAFATQAALLTTILKERRIELLGEGFRSNDIVRNLQPFPAKSGNGLIAPAVEPAQANYIFPLPNTEIITNKLLLD